MNSAELHAQVNFEIQLQTQDLDGLRLQPATQSIVLVHAQAKGTVLMYHGYTAAPWQYRELGQKFFEQGYNVYAPRMPGHGWCDRRGTPTSRLIPSSTQRQEWEIFIDRTHRQARALQVPLFAVGLSGGANVALRLREKHPDVERVVAMAPFVGGNPPGSLFLHALTKLELVTFGLFGRLLDIIPAEGNPVVPNNPTPHTRGSFGQAVTMHQVGSNIVSIPSGVQIISTAGDVLSGTLSDGRLFRRCGGPENSGWFCFPASQRVPHAMVSPAENHNLESVARIHEMVFRFIDSGERFQRH